ncbi:tRNA (adenosine(37)-N6)-threonylcarbamoyltransferase complex dimerization subunit type 1 TsaB [Rhodoferax sp.]|uniref:tRNA (adenosine(37)-N6)-threonylcarbamoyltransferase complex dimerization subunit type 1 TsaB n=1 Tax=Rhodoferax sp. TaxID=50421 RepID=UPI00374DAA4D
MPLLAFDTSTDTLSIAVTDGAQVWQHSGAGGAQASATLIPAILALLAQAGLRLDQLQAIAFGSGPGSFTGLRTACSVAQGLAFGADIPVLPIDTLMAVAEEARQQHGLQQVQAVLDARMDEIYSGFYAFAQGAWTQRDDFALLRPEDLLQEDGWALAGNAFAVYAERIPASHGVRVAALPTAAAMLRLAPVLLAAGQAVPADQALPRYIRDKVAKTTDERMAEKAALAALSAPLAPSVP